MRRFASLILTFWSGLLLAGCDGPSHPASEKQQSISLPAKSEGRAGVAPQVDTSPDTHLNVPASAYGTKVLLAGEEVLITTRDRLFRLKPNKPVEEVPAQLGDAPILHEESVAFFRDGKIRTLSLLDYKEDERLAVEHYVQFLLSAGQRLAWLSHERSGLYFLQTESAGSVQTLYKSKNELVWPVEQAETIYFIERLKSGWKIGRAPLNGSGVTFGNEHQSRVPTMLAPGPDGIYLYDGPKLGVRRISASLDAEESFAKDVICSPLSVSSRVLCAEVGRVFDIARKGAEPRLVAKEAGGPIASITANEKRVYWVVDRGPDQMSVRSALLPPL